MNIESKIWKLISYNDGYVNVLQKATKTVRVVTRQHLPSVDELAAMSEQRFDTVCREAFHGER